uniref:Thymidine kinase n=1 Tax=Pithovirus LCPAC102 TaxID=2506587 RepID=A0A481Z424_9VIRU|nr:MAG: thymidine kinase [Pithovirus LCPAC102]
MKTTNTSYFDYGSCEIIFGPMFAAKTSYLTHVLAECADIGLHVLYINHINDIRITEYSSNSITSHSSQFSGISPKVDCVKAKNLLDINTDNYDVIGIDEGQFFDDLVINVRKWVLKLNKRVMIASLDSTFEMEPFGHAHELICICDPNNIKKLSARCKRCMIETKPSRHFRLVDAGFTLKKNKSINKIEIGGKELYEAVCMKCHQLYSM